MENERRGGASAPAGALPRDGHSWVEDTYFPACLSLALFLRNRMRVTRANEMSVDSRDLDAFTSAVTAIGLLKEIFSRAAPHSPSPCWSGWSPG
jgi:hypothetical protein